MSQSPTVRRYYRLAKQEHLLVEAMAEIYWCQMTTDERDTIDNHYNRQVSDPAASSDAPPPTTALNPAPLCQVKGLSMSWSNCGTDSQGRPIGYAHEGTCDHEECTEKIDRGLAYVCGSMHGEDEISCEKYFCEKHRSGMVKRDGHFIRICADCAAALEASGEWVGDPEEGALVPKPSTDLNN